MGKFAGRNSLPDNEDSSGQRQGKEDNGEESSQKSLETESEAQAKCGLSVLRFFRRETSAKE
jgi:hypothetical protein